MQFGGIAAGLGNPGRQYEQTRHNCGFMAIELACEKILDAGGRIERLSDSKFSGILIRADLPACDPWLFVMPQTFMNASGDCVQPLLAWYKMPAEKLFVIHDDLDLAPGRIQLKKGGCNAGHNGLKSIESRLPGSEFYRIRIGIGRPMDRGNVVSWVLGHFGEEKPLMSEAIDKAASALLLVMREGPVKAMNAVNLRKKG
ncbi:MAG: aminoacyl-tRNA hydrolase [Mailhella sp.]|nr:aminoacyl-tRNA hydrolase [Mailhella sp.]